MISDEDIRRVREATDLVDLVSETVVLKQRGREYWGRCPFHDEKTPSFKVDPRSQLYHCFGCHAGGDAYGFVMHTQSLEFIDAVRMLADRANITLTEVQGKQTQGKRARLLKLMSASAEFYAQQLLRGATPGAGVARSYLGGRSMGTELARRWQLGYAPGRGALSDHLRAQGFTAEECIEANVSMAGQQGQLRDRFYERVMFPVADLQGRVIAFGGRIIGQGEPKYLNTAETSLFHKRETLYALDKAKASITNKGIGIVVEGYTDTIAMHEAGFTNTVATLGTALTMEHIKLLNRFAKRVIYLFDGDEAGKRAAVRAADLINKDITPEAGKFRVSLEVAELPAGADPADLLANKGSAALQEVLERATPLLKYAIQQSLAGAGLSSPEGRNAALRAALEVLLPIRGSILASEYIADELAPQLGVDFAAAESLFKSMPAPRVYEGQKSATTNTNAASATNQNKTEQGGTREQPVASSESARRIELQNDLIILYIEHPEVRELLSQAFERITWDTPDLTLLATELIKTDLTSENEALYALALQHVPAYAQVLSAGLQQHCVGSISDLARLLMYMLRESQLQDEIALAKIAYAQTNSTEEGDTLFKEIAEKQSELATVREKIARIPKTPL